ncbi:DEAD/DEAH box helicase [Marinicella litoralis]|uniref:Superfamily II DNA/RNA helicase n=1 Tax=Marinicella litoralis TaxID=644220 RepID=A0A4R6XWC7_9GAMM|nr:DEAD/DEAH box helicase [Marinicella litoralis]TDR22544.1 superfamily II DNA/RNA helicase [Marinicella litoralis]
MKFAALGLDPRIQQAIEQCGYQEMTPVQEQAMVPARRGKDLLVNAQTGTGKTAAFALPVLQQLLDKPKDVVAGKARVLILTPTRELAEQLAETIGAYAEFLPTKITAIYGGVKMGGQANQLKAGVDILIATPGRLLEHVEMEHISLVDVEFVVLDEADRMLDMGFIKDAQKLVAQTANNRQTMLFSATTTPAMNELAHKILKSHQEIRVTKANITAETVDHVVYPVNESRKMDLFLTLLEEHNWYQILVFTSTRKQADHLFVRLKKAGIASAICHGDKGQGSRRRALADFKSAKIQVLLATEVAARGLDIEGLDYVLNYNLPYLPEDYVHRIGRTGRAGHSGHAISFVCPEEAHTLERIERVIGGQVKRVHKRGFETVERERPARKPVVENKKKRVQKPSHSADNKKSRANHGQPTKAKRKVKKITARAGGKDARKGKRN